MAAIWAALAVGVGVCLWALVGKPVVAQQTRGDYGASQIRFRQPSQSYHVAQNANPPADQSRAAEPVLKAYPCHAGTAAAMAAQLQEEFGRAANVRIVADERTSQVLVQASPQIQARIAARLSGRQPAAAGPEAASPRVAVAQPVRSCEVRLRTATAAQIEAALVRILGARLSTVPSTAFGMRNYQLAVPGRGGVSLGIHHQTNQVTIQGAGPAVDSSVRLIRSLDGPRPTSDRSMRMISLQTANPASVRQVITALRAGNDVRPVNGRMLAAAMQQQQNQQPPAAGPPAQPAVTPPVAPGAADGPPPANGQPPAEPAEGRGLIGPVQIELLEGLDVLVIRGHKRDVDQVMQIISEIERLSAETVPAIEICHLGHVNCQALADLISPLYEQVFSPRQGKVTITALVKPNALLLIGRAEAVETVLDLVKRLDQPVAPEAQFRVFRLRHAAAASAEETIRDFFGEEQEREEQLGLGPRVLATADFRSNALIVRASPRDMIEVAALIERIDTPTSEAVNEIRVFQLENSLAEDVAQTLNEAIGVEDARRRGAAGAGGPSAATPGAAGRRQAEQRSTMLRFITIDTKGQRRLTSGILSDVRITPDVQANTLLVSAPAESMALIEGLIRRVDRLPAAEAQIKVFTIINGDANNLVEMLQSLFTEEEAAEGPAVRTGAVEGESSLVQLRFAVDVRTNSIIASGSMGDLQVVEAILLRLDGTDAWDRKTTVYRLKNAHAEDVATAINEFLQSKREVERIREDVVSPFEQIEREVIVVPELVSNSLIVSTTERFYEEIKELVEKLDERPPMVMIQVLIAEVTLNDTDEFGVELGLQDSVLFDRSLLGDLLTTQVSTSNPATGVVTTTETIQAATNTPGFLFNNQPLGNSGSQRAMVGSGVVGGQGLSHFAVGRTNSELGYGGLVLSAASESVSILIRALKECRRLDVLARPQIMTLDNQPAWVQVGQRVPMIRGTSINEAGQTNRVEFEDVGLMMAVQPRISPDGQVVMIIEAFKDAVGPEEEGIPISISATGEVIRSPRIDTTNVKTTVSVGDGQTVVLGGLITKSKSQVHRKVPLLGDIPLVRNLFRYDLTALNKTELLIIMTPHIVRNEADADMIRQIEAARMSWCLSDVLELHDGAGLRGRSDEWSDAETSVIFPDLNPSGELVPVPDDGPDGQEIIPVPEGSPFRPEMPPAGNDSPSPSTPTNAPPAAAGAAVPEPGPMPTAARPGPHRVEQAHWQGAHWQAPWYSGRVERAVYQHPGAAAGHPPGTDAVVPSTYYAPPQPYRAPMARTAPYRQPAVVPPPPYQQPAPVRWPQPQMPSYR